MQKQARSGMQSWWYETRTPQASSSGRLEKELELSVHQQNRADGWAEWDTLLERLGLLQSNAHFTGEKTEAQDRAVGKSKGFFFRTPF